MSKQTAVEWLVDYLKNTKELYFIRQDLNINEQNILNDIIEQAKEMEKEQIKDAYFIGGHDIQNNRYRGMHEYYNETYK